METALGVDIESTYPVLAAFVLLLARFSGFFATSPFFSMGMPKSVRLCVIGIPSLICTPAAAAALPSMDMLATRCVALAFKELVLGYLIGVLTWLPVRGLEFGGTILDTQTGSTQAQDFDMVSGEQVTPIALLLSQIFLACFFASGGFLIVMTMLCDSIRLWSPAELLPGLSSASVPLLIRFASAALVSAVAFILPSSGFIFLADILVVFLVRTAPSLNFLSFSAPIKSIIALGVLGLYVEIAYPAMISALSQGITLMSKVLTP